MRRVSVKKLVGITIALFGMAAQPVMADIYGLANGRSANMDNMASMSVEGGINLEGDITTYALRFNFKASPDLMVFADVGQVKFSRFNSSASGTGFGAGAFYQLRNVQLLENTDFAVKGSYHTATVSEGGFDLDLGEIAIEGLISGDQLGSTNLGWYGNLGMHILSADFGGFGGDDDSNELAFGGGVVGSLAFGDWYAGIDFIDEMFLVAGIRYNLQ